MQISYYLQMTKIIHKVGQIYGGRAVTGLWNMENNLLPTRCSIKSAVLSVHMALHARGILRPMMLHGVGNSNIPQTVKGRRELGFYVDTFITTSTLKQAADHRVKSMMRYWSKTNPAGEYLALLGSDGGYEEEAILLEERGQHLLLFGKRNTPTKLRKRSYIYWEWERLLAAHEMEASYIEDIMGKSKEQKGDYKTLG